MSETSLWNTMRKHHKADKEPAGTLERIENNVGAGTPDVLYCLLGHVGMIELKAIPSWPKRPDTIVKIDHFTKQQKVWLSRWVRCGGKAYVLLKVAQPREYLLFDAATAIAQIGATNKEQLCRCAVIYQPRIFPWTAIKNVLAPL